MRIGAMLRAYLWTSRGEYLVKIGRDILGMIAAGGNIYYLAKLAGIFKLSVQDVGGLQTGRTTEEFKEYLKSQA